MSRLELIKELDAVISDSYRQQQCQLSKMYNLLRSLRDAEDK